ncbi:hypothetical protein JZM41_14955 [Serratia marcescens]|jgi:hypothetical protein|uniref:hypothetical protein n=1 Tax=Serratia TaxID=613 RepID=UPI000745304B|nr:MULTISPECIES: hypothetical protein [Serratia]MBH2748478.1 hypothetical protein [Serratia marcescens]MBH2969492.1 hypothetical protein [Serratia marcescens]MBN6137339.1 hypothetical protein [Serratia marcescens]TXE47775.1 hypothetical protein FOT55_14560 [Serratia bockelmannii]CVF44006.1 Uncharacterised protein [Serratia marcescens]
MQTQFFHVTVEQCACQQTAPDNLVRIIASGQTFFFYRDDFSDSENLLARLAAGDRVKIGAHRLRDGSYWLHWLLHGTKGRLEPDRTLKYKLKYFALLLLGAALAGGFPAAFFIMDREDSWLTIVLFFIAIIAGLIGIGMVLFVGSELLLIAHRGRRRLLRALDRVLQGQDVTPPSSLSLKIPGIRYRAVRADAAPVPATPQTEFPLPEGVEASGIETVNALSYELCHYEIPRQVQYLDTYAWRQKETHFALTTRALNVPNTKLHPVFRRQHPLFIAKGDPLQVLYCENDTVPELPTVRGIINHRDRQTYLIGGSRYFTEAGLNLSARVVFILGAIMMCLMLGMIVWDNADTPAGFYLDAWTLKRLGSELPPIILLLMLMVSGLALLIEGFAQICRLYSFDQHRTFKTFKYLRNLRRRLWRQAQVTELK